MQEEKLNKETEEVNNEIPNESSSEDTQPQDSAAVSGEEDPLEKLQAEVNEAKDKYLRLYSEFENYKRRTQKERIDLIKTAGVEVILATLPVLDDFERAMKSMQTATDVTSVKEGVELIYNKLKNILEAKGLKAMECKGAEFNADMQDSNTNKPAPTEELKGKVIDDVQKGYYLNDKVVRHAQVIVGN